MDPSPPSSVGSANQIERIPIAARSEQGLRAGSHKMSPALLIVAMTDIDGTANDEHEPEHQRLATIGPAREAFSTLEKEGIVTGICTARSVGEAYHYRSALQLTGPLICENGGVLVFTDGSRRILGDLEKLKNGVKRISARIGRYIPNSLDWPGLEAAWELERSGKSPEFLGHPDRESLRLAADRLASCFLVGLDPAEKVEATAVAKELGLDSFGELLHLVPHGVSKGVALSMWMEHVEATTPGPPVKVVPIVFGNGENDLPLFERAIHAGGAAVLVGDPRTANGFQFDIIRHPPPLGTITLPGISHGYAIQQSLPRLAEFFAARYGIRFVW